MSFKLLAIRPMPGTDPKFLKNLKPGVIYKFYQEYGFYADDEKKIRIDDLPFEEQQNHVVKTVERISHEVPENLYSQEGGPSINISAVVGRNGSGKSSLVELFTLVLYKLSYENEEVKSLSYDIYMNNEKKFDLIIELLNAIKTDKNGLSGFIELDNLIELFEKIKKLPDEMLEMKTNFEHIKFGELLEIIEIFLEGIKPKYTYNYSENQNVSYISQILGFNTNFSTPILELIYFVKGILNELNNVSMLIDDLNTIKFQLFIEDENKKYHIIDQNSKLDKNFYTIFLNYSLHSLNTKLGDKPWLNQLFHKNDAYTTPIVINPFRKEGNIDINSEVKLNNERIFFNLCKHHFTHDEDFIIAKKYKILAVNLKIVKNSPILYTISKQIDSECSWEDYLKFISNQKDFVESQDSLDNKDKLKDALWSYAVYKFNKVKKYTAKFKSFNFDKKELNEKTIEFLNEDNTHISFKLKRVFNFLKHFDSILEVFDFSAIKSEIEVDFTSFLNLIKKFKELEPTSDVMNFFFPPFFEYNFEFQDIKNSNDIIFSDLSSGEQQSIFNISTIHYHTINIESIRNTIVENRKKYEFVNIILDEIELYYHVDLQRELMNDLRNHLTEHFKDLSFNILCLTHSPFILSDIPSQNILRLEDGKPAKEESKTFGANIHNLLKNQFFLENGFQGEFAKNEIRKVYLELNYFKFYDEIDKRKNNKIDDSYYLKLNQNIEEEYKKIHPKGINSFYKQDKFEEYKKDNKSRYKAFIQIIGEPLIKRELEELYDSVYDDKDEKIKRIERLMKELNVSKDQLNPKKDA